MKKIVLSTVASIAVLSTVASADVTVKSGASTLKFSGTHYLGLTKYSDDRNSSNDYTKFETRRNYLQVKAYFNDAPKSYMRVTLDQYNTADGTGSVGMRVKYAYLYLDNILPYTGVEMGQAHTPWIDYEEHNGWKYRSISETFIEQHNGVHATASSGRGINFKTKTSNFSSELGLFNGEGYHEDQGNNNGLAAEARLTWHVFGTGKTHHSNEYLNLSLFGADSQKHKGRKDINGNYVDLKWAGIHGVYATEQFLLAAQYVKVNDGNYYDGGKKYVEGNGYSVNGSFKFAPKWDLFARYDDFKFDADGRASTSGNTEERKTTIGGVSYKYNKYVKFLANIINNKNTAFNGSTTKDDKKAMLTAEVNW